MNTDNINKETGFMEHELFNDHISQGISLMAAGNFQAAKTEFQAAIDIDVNNARAYTHLGNACTNLMEFDEALEAFKKVLIIEPNSADTFFSIASVYLLKNDKLRAVEYYNKAEQAGFDRPELYQILASIFYDSNDTAQALRNITKAIALAPLEGELRMLKVRIYLADNRFEEALEVLEDMQKILPDAFEAYDLQVQIYMGQGKLQKALEVAQLGCDRFPDDVMLALTKLKVLVAMGEDGKALKLLADMKRMENYDLLMKEAVMQEALIYLRKANVDVAMKLLTEANDKLGGDPDILYVLMDLYAKLDRHEKTIEAAQTLIAMEPNDYYLYTAKYFVGHCNEQMGKVGEAKTIYRKLTSELRKATIANPAFYEGYIYRLLCHTRLGEYEKALSLAEYIENLHPDRADGHSFRYHIYKTMGDMEKAEAEKKLALAIDPNVQL